MIFSLIDTSRHVCRNAMSKRENRACKGKHRRAALYALLSSVSLAAVYKYTCICVQVTFSLRGDAAERGDRVCLMVVL